MKIELRDKNISFPKTHYHFLTLNVAPNRGKERNPPFLAQYLN